MERKTAHDFDQELLILFDAYVHGAIDRRGFLEKAAKYAVGGVTAVMLLDQLSPKFVEAQVIKTDIARRLAVDNFVAFAPDALFPLGGYPGDEDKARELFGKLDQAKIREDFVTAVSWLKARPEGNGKVGAVGFCYGGGI